MLGFQAFAWCSLMSCELWRLHTEARLERQMFQRFHLKTAFFPPPCSLEEVRRSR